MMLCWRTAELWPLTHGFSIRRGGSHARCSALQEASVSEAASGPADKERIQISVTPASAKGGGEQAEIRLQLDTKMGRTDVQKVMVSNSVKSFVCKEERDNCCQ